VKVFGSNPEAAELACPSLHILDEAVQVHVMHIAVKQPDFFAPQVNALKVHENHDAGERIVYDPSQNTGSAHIAGCELSNRSSEGVRGFEHLPTLLFPPTTVQAQPRTQPLSFRNESSANYAACREQDPRSGVG
jgi:hypothetical protein